MKILSTWKLLRTTRPIRIRSPFVRHTPLTYQTRNFPPPVPLTENAKHRGYFPGCFSPFAGTTYYRVGARIATRLVLSCIVMHLFALYLLFLPPLLSLVPEADAAAPQFDYGVDVPSYLPEQPGKPPLDHQLSPILLYTACIRVV